MIWPLQQRAHVPATPIPPDYALRTYRVGDEAAWCAIQAGADQDQPPVVYEAVFQEYVAAVLPEGLFFAVHAPTSVPVATAGAVHNTRQGMFPFGGELGWVATAPAHRRCGLGRAVSAAATARLIRAGYTSIRLGTQDHSLPAIQMYLRLGYEPYLYLPTMYERWRAICRLINWPFTPQEWPAPP